MRIPIVVHTKPGVKARSEEMVRDVRVGELHDIPLRKLMEGGR